MTEHIQNVPDNLTDCRGHYVYVSYSTVLNINARHGETERDMSAQHHLLIVHDIQSGGESAYIGRPFTVSENTVLPSDVDMRTLTGEGVVRLIVPSDVLTFRSPPLS